MKVDILIKNADESGKFSDIEILFNEISGARRTVNLFVNFEPLFDLAQDTDSIAFDFFLVSSIIYGIDCVLDRYEYSVDAWARNIEVCIPINNVAIWEKNKYQLEKVVSFLTGDHWAINFTELAISNIFEERKGRRRSKIVNHSSVDYSFMSLFSGGLDSLIGVINESENLSQGKKGLLISHFDSTSPGTNKDQERLYGYLSSDGIYLNKLNWIQVGVYASTRDTSGKELNKESSLRSRSLLFLGIGVYCVENASKSKELLIPENGTISLNFPLTPSRSSSLSTRTTHPHYLRELQILLTSVGLQTKLNNPYTQYTKGEMVASCSNLSVLRGIYAQSVSCGKRGRKMHWENKIGTSHCGVCMPCIYRRAALHKMDLDNQLYGIDILSTTKNFMAIQDIPALVDFLNNKADKESIKRTLLVSGSLLEDELDTGADLVLRVKDEIRAWAKHKSKNQFHKML